MREFYGNVGACLDLNLHLFTNKDGFLRVESRSTSCTNLEREGEEPNKGGKLDNQHDSFTIVCSYR